MSERPARHALTTPDFTKAPFRLGVLTDLPGFAGLSDVWVDGLRLALEYCTDEGLVDRPVELVIREVVGQPWQDPQQLIRAWNELVDEGVLGVAGPMTTDNSLALLPEIERRGVSTMTICGSQLYVGDAAFNLSNGGMGDEPALIAAWLANEGHRRVAVLYDSPSQIGAEYLQYFLLSAAQHRLELAAQIPISPTPSQEEMDRSIAQAKASGAQAVVYLMLGAPEAVSKLPDAFGNLGWAPPRIATTAFVGASYNDQLRAYYEGWNGVDQVHEENTVFAQVLDMWEKRFGYRPFNSAASCAWDIGHAFGVALGRMRLATAAGLRTALETVRRLPAATGGPGTIVTFGPQDHRGFKGPDFLVLRRVERGQYLLTGTVPVTF